MNNLPSRSLILPLFSLSAVVFPGEAVALHIFEERYKEMMNNCLSPDGLARHPDSFGIVLARKGGLASVGCSVSIEKIVGRYDDGRMDIITRGTRRFRRGSILTAKSYQEIEVQFFDDINTEETVTLSETAIALHLKLVELAKGEPYTFTPAPPGKLAFQLAHNCGLELDQRQHLLELRSEQERLTLLVEHYRRIIPAASKNEILKAQVRLNGHIPTLLA
jgi:ATP-dependent Lon protease